ncbi:MAG: DUF4351 domain-containing protein [Magnetococcus sp. YQC-5]
MSGLSCDQAMTITTPEILPSETSRIVHWHALLGKLLEETLTWCGVSVQTEVDVVSASPKADIILLRREGETWTETQKMWLADGLRDTTAREVMLEFKFTESLSEFVIAQLFVYDHLYRVKQKLSRSELQSFLLLAKTPTTDTMERFGFAPTDKAGVYATRIPMFDVLRIIVLNQLTDEPHNAVLKCFSSVQKERKKAFASMDRHGQFNLSETLWQAIIGIRRMLMKENVQDLEQDVITVDVVMEWGREWIENRMNSLTKEELFAFSKPAKILQEALAEGQREILSHQLCHRFGPISDQVVGQIQMADKGVLEKWSERILDARSIEDVFAV